MTDFAALDRFDHALLAQVQQNNLTPARVLGERVGLSESAVLRRLKRLRKEGVIVADVAIVDAAVAGESVSMHVLVSLERERASDLDTFIRHVRGRPEVKSAWYVTGEYDFVLLLKLHSIDAYADFVRDVFHDNANVKAFKTIVSIREVTTARAG